MATEAGVSEASIKKIIKDDFKAKITADAYLDVLKKKVLP